MTEEPTKQIDDTLPPQTGSISTVRGIIPQTVDDVYRLANIVVKSGTAPDSWKTAAKVSVAIMHGAELGLGPMTSLKQIAVINGRPSIWGDGAMALVLASGLLEYRDERIEGEGDERKGVCEIQRKGLNRQTYEFSVADAKQAKLWLKKGPWTDYTNRMLKMRARGFALRDNFADYLSGVHLAEEAMDMETVEMRDITPENPLGEPEEPSEPNDETVA